MFTPPRSTSGQTETVHEPGTREKTTHSDPVFPIRFFTLTEGGSANRKRRRTIDRFLFECQCKLHTEKTGIVRFVLEHGSGIATTV